MDMTPLRLNADTMKAPIPAIFDTPTERIYRLTGTTSTPRVLQALERTSLRFSLVPRNKRTIRITMLEQALKV